MPIGPLAIPTNEPFEPDPDHAGEGTGSVSKQKPFEAPFLTPAAPGGPVEGKGWWIMSVSEYIARLVGPVFVAIAIGMLVRRKTMVPLLGDFIANPALIYFAGMASLAIGLAVVNSHNLWVADWRVIVTLFGWAAIFGGLFRLWAPDVINAMGQTFIDRQGLLMGSLIFALALGVFLSLKGYGIL